MLSVQVNLRAITKNIATIKKQLRPNTKFCAVVKSNAYGFGLERISRLISPLVDCFAVMTLAEGIALRSYGINQDILLLGVTTDFAAAIKHNLIVTLNTVAEAKYLQQNNLHPRLHIAVNTGMNRFGINSVHELRAILQTLPDAKIEGCYTHLAYEADHPAQIDQALTHFQKFTSIVKQYYPNAILHAGCSGVINYPAAHLDMLRIGKAMYGGTPDTQTALTIKSRIVAIKKIKTGATVGYNGEFTAPQAMVIGVVQGGYAHGIQRQFSGNATVMVDKQHCPVIGRVCMDCFYIDVTAITKPLGKTVTIMTTGHGQSLMDLARATQTIPCYLLQGFRY